MVESTDSLVQGLRSLAGLLLLFPELLERPRPLPVVEETRKLLKVLAVVLIQCDQIQILSPRPRSGCDVDITPCVFDGLL